MTELLLQVAPDIHVGMAAAEDMAGAVADRVKQAAAKVLGDLGLPGGVSATIRDSSAGAAAVTVNGTAAIRLEAALREARAFAMRDEEGKPGDSSPGEPKMPAAEQLPDFFGHLVGGALERQPELLISPQVVDAVAASLRETHEVQIDGDRRATLAEVLERLAVLGISIRDTARLAEVLKSSGSAGARQIAEEAAAELTPSEMEVCISAAYLRELTPGKTGDVVRPARARLIDDVGVGFPPVHFVEDNTLPARCFYFRLRHLASQPRCGFGAGWKFIAQVRPAYEILSTRFESVLDPRSGGPGRIAAEIYAPLLTTDGTALSPLEYVMECLRCFAVERAPRLMDKRVAKKLLDNLALFPQLTAAVKQRIAPWILTGVLRELIASGLSIRDLHDALDAFLDRPYAASTSVQVAVLGELEPIARGTGEGDSVEHWMAFVHRRARHPLRIGYGA